MQEFPATEALCLLKNPLDESASAEALLLSSCQEMAQHHRASSPVIDRIYSRYQFQADSLASTKDLWQLPHIGVSAMKAHLLTSLPHDRAVLKLTSSGTKGQKTQIWFDQESLRRVQSMLDGIWNQEGFVSTTPVNYLMMIYDPGQATDLGTAFTRKNHQRFAPIAREHYAVVKNQEGDWYFRSEETLRSLEEYAEDGKPLRILGLPVFIHELVELLEKMGKKFKFPADSLVMTGGGWKSAENRSIPKAEFRARIHERTGIPVERIRDGYGMAEHSAPYMECSQHSFHVPSFNRIFILDPVSLKPLPPGEPGLMKLVTSYNAMMPNLSILSTDIGVLGDAPCSCGHTTPTFQVVGRGGISKHRGCALHASDILRKKK